LTDDEVVVAHDGVEAIDYLFAPERSSGDMPRLVLLDLDMPRLNGFGVLKKMRQEERMWCVEPMSWEPTATSTSSPMG
jgi:CheY-like chemotaxis protein